MTRKRLSHLLVGAAACISVLLSVPILSASSDPSAEIAGGNGLASGIRALDNKSYKDAVEHLSYAIMRSDLDPANLALAYYHRGIARQELGDMINAMDDYTKAVTSGELPDETAARAYYNRAIILAEKGDSRRAELDYGQAIDLMPDYAAAYHNRANLERQRQDYPTAIRDYSKAISLLNGDKLKLPLLGRAIAYEKSGNVAAAQDDLEAALALDVLYAPALARREALAPLAVAMNSSSSPQETDHMITASIRKDGPESKIIQTSFLGKDKENPVRSGIKIEKPTSEAMPAYRVQLGAYKAPDLAGRAWKDLTSREEKLADFDHRVEKADLGKRGTFYRLQAGAFASRAEAKSHCSSLAEANIDCIVVAIR